MGCLTSTRRIRKKLTLEDQQTVTVLRGCLYVSPSLYGLDPGMISILGGEYVLEGDQWSTAPLQYSGATPIRLRKKVVRDSRLTLVSSVKSYIIHFKVKD